MTTQILKHTTQNRLGEDLYKVAHLCELTIQFVHKSKNDQSSPDLNNYITSIAHRVELSPDRIVHPTGRTARNERLVTIDNFIDAVSRCRRYVVDVDEVALFLDSMFLKPDGSTFIHQPATTVITPFDGGPELEVRTTSWSLGDKTDENEKTAFNKLSQFANSY